MITDMPSFLDTYLSEQSIFRSLNKSEQKQVASAAILRKYPQGDFITLHGDVWPFLFLVNSGEVKVLKESGENRSLIIELLQPGELFWGAGFFNTRATNPVAMQAASDCELYLWSHDQLKSFITRDGNVAWELIGILIDKMLRASDIMEELAFQPLTGRLANLLLQHYGDAEGSYVSRDLTLDEMAARIGSTREMVCKILYRFAANGTVEMRRTEFMISDRKKLSEIGRKTK